MLRENRRERGQTRTMIFSLNNERSQPEKRAELAGLFLIHRTISGTLAIPTLLAYINFNNLFGLLQK